MPLSALPEHLKNVENNFPDDDQYTHIPILGRMYRWFNKRTKTWFAFSYRCTERWARWRKYPIVLFAIGDKSSWRLESDKQYYVYTFYPKGDLGNWYLSRIQYYKRWHFAIQWPLMVSFHFYPKAEDVPKCGEPRPDLDGRLWFAYWGHFDADLVYWMFTSAYIGRNWK